MNDLTSKLAGMTRPRILTRTARQAAAATLRRRARTGVEMPARPFSKLLEREAELDAARRAGTAGYSPTRHVEALTELLAAAGYGALPGA